MYVFFFLFFIQISAHFKCKYKLYCIFSLAVKYVSVLKSQRFMASNFFLVSLGKSQLLVHEKISPEYIKYF